MFSFQRAPFIKFLLLVTALATAGGYFFTNLHAFGVHNQFWNMGRYDFVALQFVLFEFLHGGWGHWISNAFFLLIFGTALERSMGTRKYILFFILTHIFLFLILIRGAVPTIGISGFAMANLSYIMLQMYKTHNEEWKTALMLLVINIGIGLQAQISFEGHLWGAVAGVVLYFGMKVLRR